MTAPNPIDGMTVILQDQGQDFLEFDIQLGRIIATRPAQGWVWNGRIVADDHIAIGDCIRIAFSEGIRSLLYPVTEIRPLARVAIGPTNV